jgi:hypothetical protein
MFAMLSKCFRGVKLKRRTLASPRRTFRPALEGLEDRQLMSANLPLAANLGHLAPAVVSSPMPDLPVVHILPPLVGAVANPPFEILTPLHGQGGGTYSIFGGIPDIGHRVDLHGTVSIQGLGRMTVQGSLYSLGFVYEGHAGGTLTLSNAEGSLTLKLTGPLQPGFSALPTDFKYEVVSGTGIFSHAADSGTLHLSFHVRAILQPPGQPNLSQWFDVTITSDHQGLPPVLKHHPHRPHHHPTPPVGGHWS